MGEIRPKTCKGVGITWSGERAWLTYLGVQAEFVGCTALGRRQPAHRGAAATGRPLPLGGQAVSPAPLFCAFSRRSTKQPPNRWMDGVTEQDAAIRVGKVK